MKLRVSAPTALAALSLTVVSSSIVAVRANHHRSSSSSSSSSSPYGSSPIWGATGAPLHRRPRGAGEIIGELFGGWLNSNSLFRHHHHHLRKQRDHHQHRRYSGEGSENEPRDGRSASRSSSSRNKDDDDYDDERDQDATTTATTTTTLENDDDPVTYDPRFYLVQLDDGAVELTMELPGVSPEDLSIEIEDNSMLRVRGSRRMRSVTDGGRWITATFDEVFELGPSADVERISVRLSRGILRIVSPKKKTKIRKLWIANGDHDDDVDEEKDGNKGHIITPSDKTTGGGQSKSIPTDSDKTTAGGQSKGIQNDSDSKERQENRAVLVEPKQETRAVLVEEKDDDEDDSDRNEDPKNARWDDDDIVHDDECSWQ